MVIMSVSFLTHEITRSGGRYNYYNNSELLMSIKDSTADKITGSANILLWFIAYILMEAKPVSVKG